MRRALFGVMGALLAPILTGQVTTSPVTAERGMVVSAEPHATAVGVQILRAGGSAIDAAVAVGFALSVTWPSAGNLGGGGFMVIHLPTGKDIAVDYREMAPAAAHRNLYVDAEGRPIPELSVEGHLAAGVPGSVAGLCHVQERYGSLPLARVIAPAIELARTGFPVSRFLASSLRGSRRRLGAFPESRRVFLNGGELWAEGATFRQPDLARTLERIAAEGARGFYEGSTADLIFKEMKRGGGLMTLDDLKHYEVKERAALRGIYRGYDVVSMPPPSSGGAALIQMLNIMEGWPVGQLGFGSERSIHLTVEAMRLAFRDRSELMGDPDFCTIPVAGLLSKSYAARLRRSIGETASASKLLEASDVLAFEKEQTTHYSVMDARGVAVACTTTLNGSYGSGVTVLGAGFLLNNEMDDFAIAPGQPNMYDLVQGEANAVGPKKRPLSSMTPTLLLRDGKVLMVIGSPGGPTIINTVLQCIQNVVDHGMDVAQAIAAPRVHHQWLPDCIQHEAFGINPDVARGLRARGHVLRERGTMGDAHGIWFDVRRKLFHGAADPRNGGAAQGL